MTPKRKALHDYWVDRYPDEVSPPLFGNEDGDPLDEAVIGLTELAPAGGEGWRSAWVYDGEKLRAILLRVEPDEDAVDDHIAYNLDGSCTAEGPVIVWPVTSDESAPG